MATEYATDKAAAEALRRERGSEPSEEDKRAARELMGPNFNPPLRQSELVDLMMEYESGEGSQANMLRLFGDLIRTRTVWGLQGFYGRQANNLIEVGAIDKDGTILYPLDLA